MSKLPDHQKGVDAIGRAPATAHGDVLSFLKTHREDPTRHPQHNVARRKHRKLAIKEADFDSSCIESASFDPGEEILSVTFVKGDQTYDFDCTKREWKELLNAGSAGGYLNDEIL